MTREELNNKIHSKIVNDELYEDEIMEDIMQLVDVHVKEQLRIGVVSQQRELLMAFALYVVNEPTKSIDDLIIDFEREHCSH